MPIGCASVSRFALIRAPGAFASRFFGIVPNLMAMGRWVVKARLAPKASKFVVGSGLTIRGQFAWRSLGDKLVEITCLRCLTVIGTGTSETALCALEKAHRCPNPLH